MVIQSSDVAMGSGRTYQRQSRDRSSVRDWGEVLSATTDRTSVGTPASMYSARMDARAAMPDSFLPTATESRTVTQRETKTDVAEVYLNYSSGGQIIGSISEKYRSDTEVKTKTEESGLIYEIDRKSDDSSSKDRELTISVSETMFGRLFANRDDDEGRPLTVSEIFSLLLRRQREQFERFVEHFRIGMNTARVESRSISISWGDTEMTGMVSGGKRLAVHGHEYSQEVEESENETTTFDTIGKVKTADGKEIDFDVSLMMSRGMEKQAKASNKSLDMRLCDPLVINFDAPSADLTDKKFSFDLDADGELDNIAVLGQACGFLAYDANEDGQINDGTELFGTKSGDGFADLAVYDVDGNGWIDEADPIFDKLKIWSKDPDGKDILVGLGVRGIGAIFLGHMPTEFTVKEPSDETLGVIRSSGVFLREDGSAGTIQHVDMAVQKAG